MKDVCFTPVLLYGCAVLWVLWNMQKNEKKRSAWVGLNSRAATISQIIAKMKHSLKISRSFLIIMNVFTIF